MTGGDFEACMPPKAGCSAKHVSRSATKAVARMVACYFATLSTIIATNSVAPRYIYVTCQPVAVDSKH